MIKTILLAALVLTLSACTPTATQRDVAEYTDDTVVSARVKLALANAPGVKATEIQVETFRGVVQLSGFAESPDAIEVAVHTARGVSGVREVKNDIRLRTGTS